jgi:hypothetical protein
MMEEKKAKSDKPRKNGSILTALIAGVLVGIIGIAELAHAPPYKCEDAINGGSGILFAIVLLWWVFSDENPYGKFRWSNPFYLGRHWGIGFETVTMVVTVVSALVIIFTLTDAVYNREKDGKGSGQCWFPRTSAAPSSKG